MSAPTLPKKTSFSPLDPTRVAKVLDSCAATLCLSNVDLAPVAVRVAEISAKSEYDDLVAAARSGELSAEFIESNFQRIAGFLNQCGLIGYAGEYPEEKAEKKGPFSIGAEGLALITAYQRSKSKNAAAHDVVVVRNEDLETASGSKKTADIFTENRGVHTGLAKALQKDLSDNAAVDFNRTYLIETFGAAGGNHVVSLTVRRRVGEECPVFDLFDSSPGLIRGNLASCQDAAINGWNAQMQINATLNEVLGDKFDREKFYHNMEPFQVAGASNCSIFAYEKAWITAAMSREEHEALLAKHYKFDSPCGGKCELAIDMDRVAVDGGVANPQFNLPAQYMVLSNFLSSSVHKFYLEALESKVEHDKKSGEAETGKERLEKHTLRDGAAPISKLIEEKAFRQKYGHLLEMVCNPDFVGRFARDGVAPALVDHCYYAASYKDGEVGEEELPYVKAINKILPMTNRVYGSSVIEKDGGEKFCRMVVFISKGSAQKFSTHQPLKDAGIVFDEVPESTASFPTFGKEVDPRLRQGVCLAFEVPMQEATLSKIAEVKRSDFSFAKPNAVATSAAGEVLSGGVSLVAGKS